MLVKINKSGFVDFTLDYPVLYTLAKKNDRFVTGQYGTIKIDRVLVHHPEHGSVLFCLYNKRSNYPAMSISLPEGVILVMSEKVELRASC